MDLPCGGPPSSGEIEWQGKIMTGGGSLDSSRGSPPQKDGFKDKERQKGERGWTPFVGAPLRKIVCHSKIKIERRERRFRT